MCRLVVSCGWCVYC